MPKIFYHPLACIFLVSPLSLPVFVVHSCFYLNIITGISFMCKNCDMHINSTMSFHLSFSSIKNFNVTIFMLFLLNLSFNLHSLSLDIQLASLCLPFIYPPPILSSFSLAFLPPGFLLQTILFFLSFMLNIII